MLEEALAYASQGFHIFPILPGAKEPPLTGHGGYKHATTDPEQIRAWWTAHPSANIGYVPGRSGVVVADVDPKNDPDPAIVAMLTETLSVRTPSGGRHHHYDAGGKLYGNGRLAQGIDIRCATGYVLLPPSVVDGRAYEWVDQWAFPQPFPAWAVERLEKPAAEPRHTDKRIDEIDTPDRIERIRELASTWPPTVSGGGTSNDDTVELVNRLLDLCSHEPVLTAIMECWVPRCSGEWTEAWVSEKVFSVKPGNGRDSDIGCEDYPIAYDYRPVPKGRVTLKNGGNTQVKKVEWVWDGWLAAGKLHILAGSPGAGKSTLCFGLMATVSTGGLWPDGTEAPLGDVLVWSGEDNFEDTILPRFIASGGDRTRLYCVAGVGEGDDRRAFDPSTDMPALLETVRQLPDLKLVVLDPVVNAVGAGKDSHKNTEVRRGLQPIVDFAEERGLVLVGITHFTKGTEGRDPTERVTGSLAFGALARVVLAASADEEGEQRRIVRSKSNIGPTGGGFEYRLVQGADGQSVVWGKKLHGAARDLLGDTPVQKAVEVARVFLAEFLADGKKYTRDITEAATAHGITTATLRRAQVALAIKPKQNVGAIHGGWYWELPPVEE